MAGGRPRIIDSPEAMEALGESYFAECRANKSHITVTGLVLALGLAHRECLIEYGKREEFSDTVKRLKTVCENYAENRLYENNPTGAIFALKNHGWTDKTQQELSGPNGGNIPIEIICDLDGNE